MTNNAPPDDSFAPPPGAIFRQFRPTDTRQQAVSNRLARAAWGEIRRISLHEKKEKISLVQNRLPVPKPRERGGEFRRPVAPHEDAQNSMGGVLRIFANHREKWPNEARLVEAGG
jgi:hypothetical protein